MMSRKALNDIVDVCCFSIVDIVDVCCFSVVDVVDVCCFSIVDIVDVCCFSIVACMTTRKYRTTLTLLCCKKYAH